MRMWRDFFRLRREILRGAFKDDILALRWPVRDPSVRIHDRGGLQILGDGLLSCDVPAPEWDLDPRSMRSFPDDEVLLDNVRPVLLRIQDQINLVRNVLLRNLRSDLRRFAGRDLPVHDGAGNPESLLPATLSAREEPGPIE